MIRFQCKGYAWHEALDEEFPEKCSCDAARCCGDHPEIHGGDCPSCGHPFVCFECGRTLPLQCN